jgi:acyl-CoA synthetase (AMP-forming)/AMP-acid ligase II
VIEMGNNMDSVIFYLGCLFRGTVAILVHENLSEFELSEYIVKFEPEYLFLSMDYK